MRKLVSLVLATLYLSALLCFGLKSLRLLKPFIYNPDIEFEQTRQDEKVMVGPNRAEFPRIELSAIRLGSSFRLLPAHVVYGEAIIRLRYRFSNDAEAVAVSGSKNSATFDNAPVADLSIENAKLLESLFSRRWNGHEGNPTKIQFNVRGLRVVGAIGSDFRIRTINVCLASDSAELTESETNEFAAKLRILLKGQ